MPSRTLGRPGSFYVAVGLPKMRRLAARREHVLVEQPALTTFLECLAKDKRQDELIFSEGPVALAAAFKELVRALGLPGGGVDRTRGMIGTSAFLFSRVLYPQWHEEVRSWWGGEGNVVVAE